MNNKTIESKLSDYMFPVVEKAVYIDDDTSYKRTKNYKAIVREDNGRLISIMKDTYQLVPNQRSNYASLRTTCTILTQTG